MRNFLKNELWIWLPGALVAIVLVRNGLGGASCDFEVYWRTAKEILSGEPIYSTARAGNMVAKYPPWVLTAFLPLGGFSFDTAKTLWHVGNALAYLGILVWLRAQGARGVAIGLGSLCFLGIWSAHAYLGQVAIFLCAFSTLGFRAFTQKKRGIAFQVWLWAASSKIFTLFSMLAFRFRKQDIKTVGVTLVLWAVASLPIVVSSSLSQMGSAWFDSATSGTQGLQGKGTISICGREAQGFPSFIFRQFKLDESNVFLIALVCLMSGVVLASFWKKVSQSLSSLEQWVGWIGLTACIQPLAGFYSYCLAFPLSVIALDRAFRSKDYLRISFTFFGVLMISCLTQKTLGIVVGTAAEAFSVKSWGVLLTCCSLTYESWGFRKT